MSLTFLKYVLEMYLVPCRVVRSFKGMGLKVLLFTEEEAFEWTLEEVYKFTRCLVGPPPRVLPVADRDAVVRYVTERQLHTQWCVGHIVA